MGALLLLHTFSPVSLKRVRRMRRVLHHGYLSLHFTLPSLLKTVFDPMGYLAWMDTPFCLGRGIHFQTHRQLDNQSSPAEAVHVRLLHCVLQCTTGRKHALTADRRSRAPPAAAREATRRSTSIKDYKYKISSLRTFSDRNGKQERSRFKMHD